MHERLASKKSALYFRHSNGHSVAGNLNASPSASNFNLPPAANNSDEAQCTFHPKINRSASAVSVSQSAATTNAFDRLYNEAQLREHKNLVR